MSRLSQILSPRAALVALVLFGVFAAIGQARPARADEAFLVWQPNLVVQSTRFINWGDDVYLQFTIKNIGNANAGPFKMNVESFSGATVQQFLSNGLAPGQTTVHAHKLPACVPLGQVSRTIVADAGNLVAESNEGDNELTKNYFFGPAC